MLEERVDKRKVDYIVLCLGGTLYNDYIKVITVRTGNIQKSIERQGENIYEYVGEDILMCDFQAMHRNVHITPQCIFEEDQVNIEFEYLAESLDKSKRQIFLRIFYFPSFLYNCR